MSDYHANIYEIYAYDSLNPLGDNDTLGDFYEAFFNNIVSTCGITDYQFVIDPNDFHAYLYFLDGFVFRFDFDSTYSTPYNRTRIRFLSGNQITIYFSTPYKDGESYYDFSFIYKKDDSYNYWYYKSRITFPYGSAVRRVSMRIIYENVPYLNGYRFAYTTDNKRNDAEWYEGDYLDATSYLYVGTATHYKTNDQKLAFVNLLSGHLSLDYWIGDTNGGESTSIKAPLGLKSHPLDNEIYYGKLCLSGYFVDGIVCDFPKGDVSGGYLGNEKLHDYLYCNLNEEGYIGQVRTGIKIDDKDYYGKIGYGTSGSTSTTTTYALLFQND